MKKIVTFNNLTNEKYDKLKEMLNDNNYEYDEAKYDTHTENFIYEQILLSMDIKSMCNGVSIDEIIDTEEFSTFITEVVNMCSGCTEVESELYESTMIELLQEKVNDSDVIKTLKEVML